MVFENSSSDLETWSILMPIYPCRPYIHLAFTYSVGPSSVVWSELGLAPPFPPMRVLELYGSRALGLVCEVALSSWQNQGDKICEDFAMFDPAPYIYIHILLRYHPTTSVIPASTRIHWCGNPTDLTYHMCFTQADMLLSPSVSLLSSLSL